MAAFASPLGYRCTLLCLLLLGAGAWAQDEAPAKKEPDKDYLLPAAEIIGFDLLLNQYNRRFSGSTDYDANWSTVRRNLRGPWVVDNDPFKVNQFAHPYQGSLYHGAARASGLSYWEASAYTFAGSAWWEITGERTPPARNDQIASGIAGSFLGEPLFRMARLLLKDEGGKDLPYTWRKWGAALVSPPLALNHALFGTRFDSAFDDHDPAYYGRLRLGSNRITRGSSLRPEDRRSDVEADFELDYGLPGQPGYTYTRPFDYFSFRFTGSSAGGVQYLSTRGLLLGTGYSLGETYRGLWGLYADYDYFAPQIFNLSTTALSVGTTMQWWLSQKIALQGTALAGLGWSAANTSRGGENVDTEYHYGMAPRAALALRATYDARASLDFTAQRYDLGRIANRSAGRDEISRLDAALTWRVRGRHAIGMKWMRAKREASFASVGDRIQEINSVGVYYTLLGLDNFGTVDWK